VSWELKSEWHPRHRLLHVLMLARKNKHSTIFVRHQHHNREEADGPSLDAPPADNNNMSAKKLKTYATPRNFQGGVALSLF
jgi:hypothetical protein